tara:strand:- start:850 stop:1095 length:246 start_codon:yes stop_codon:yes gene_type:complete
MDRDKIVEILESDIVRDAMSYLNEEEKAIFESFVNDFVEQANSAVSSALSAIAAKPTETGEILTKLLSDGVLKQWLTQERR